MRTLYLCYFGLREPLVQTQVLPYLRQIRQGGIDISLLTFEPNLQEKWTKEEIKTEREKLSAEGINWHFLAYHKSPSVPATFYDVLNGARYTRELIEREKIDVLHARIQIPALIAAVARKLSRRKPKLIFDIRGFFPEEYTDAGIWKENGWLYKTVKRNEKWLLKEADGFVVLTEKARQILFPESADNGFDKFDRPVEVIPCCIDPARFAHAATLDRSAIRREMNLDGRRVFVYAGSFGGWYLTDEMTRFFAQAHRQNPATFTMILTQSDAAAVKQKLVSAGIAEKDFLVIKVSPKEVPVYLKAADAAISFIKACYSKQSSSPTKIAEYLASGLPVISNSGVGDLDELIEGEKAGIILKGFTENDYAAALTEIDEFLKDANISEHCIEIAHRKFDIAQVAGKNYRRLYKRLLTDG